MRQMDQEAKKIGEEYASWKAPETGGIEPDQKDVLTSEVAIQRIHSGMDELEIKKELNFDKSAFIEEITDLLRIASKTEDPQAYKFFKNDGHFQKLKIGSKYLIQNLFDRDLHEKILTYFGNIGIETTDEEKREIEIFFEKN